MADGNNTRWQETLEASSARICATPNMGCKKRIGVGIGHPTSSSFSCWGCHISRWIICGTTIGWVSYTCINANIVRALVYKDDGSAGQTQWPERPTNVYQIIIGYPKGLFSSTDILAVADIVVFSQRSQNLTICSPNCSTISGSWGNKMSVQCGCIRSTSSGGVRQLTSSYIDIVSRPLPCVLQSLNRNS